MATKAVSFRLPEELVERLKKVAEKYGTSQNLIAQNAIERELRRIESEKTPLFK